MQIVTNEDIETIKIIINGFIIENEVDSKERIPIEFMRYLRNANMKIENGALINEICDSIEKKLIIND